MLWVMPTQVVRVAETMGLLRTLRAVAVMMTIAWRTVALAKAKIAARMESSRVGRALGLLLLFQGRRLGGRASWLSIR